MLNPSCSEVSPSRSLVLAASSRYEWASLFRDVFDTALDLSAATQAYDALALKLAQKRDAFRLARRRSLLESITTTHPSEQRTSLSDDMVVDNVQHRLTAQDTRTPQRAERPPDEDDEVLAVVPDTPTDDIEDSPSLPNVRARGGGMWTSWAASHEVRVADDRRRPFSPNQSPSSARKVWPFRKGGELWDTPPGGYSEAPQSRMDAPHCISQGWAQNFGSSRKLPQVGD